MRKITLSKSIKLVRQHFLRLKNPPALSENGRFGMLVRCANEPVVRFDPIGLLIPVELFSQEMESATISECLDPTLNIGTPELIDFFSEIPVAALQDLQDIHDELVTRPGQFNADAFVKDFRTKLKLFEKKHLQPKALPLAPLSFLENVRPQLSEVHRKVFFAKFIVECGYTLGEAFAVLDMNRNTFYYHDNQVADPKRKEVLMLKRNHSEELANYIITLNENDRTNKHLPKEFFTRTRKEQANEKVRAVLHFSERGYTVSSVLQIVGLSRHVYRKKKAGEVVLSKNQKPYFNDHYGSVLTQLDLAVKREARQRGTNKLSHRQVIEATRKVNYLLSRKVKIKYALQITGISKSSYYRWNEKVAGFSPRDHVTFGKWFKKLRVPAKQISVRR